MFLSKYNHDGATLRCMVLPLLTLMVPSAFSEDLINAEAEFEYNDNITNGQHSGDVLDDTSLLANLSGGKYWQMTNRIGLTVSADLLAVRQNGYTGLDHLAPGLSVALHGKLGLGRDAPWLRLSGNGAWYKYRSDVRDGWHYGLAIAAGKRFGDRLDLHAAYHVDYVEPDQIIQDPFLVSTYHVHSDAFRTHTRGVTLGAVFSATDRLAILADWTHQSGTVTSTINAAGLVFDDEDIVTPDPAFGANHVAYRSEVTTDILTGGISWALDQHASFNAVYTYRYSDGAGDFSYVNNIVNFNMLYSY
jgi:hypothetical protein